jgi:hypothetical protein
MTHAQIQAWMRKARNEAQAWLQEQREFHRLLFAEIDRHRAEHKGDSTA